MMPMVSGLTFMLSDILGVWQVSVSYDGDHIRGSPFNIHVYDPNSVEGVRTGGWNCRVRSGIQWWVTLVVTKSLEILKFIQVSKNYTQASSTRAII